MVSLDGVATLGRVRGRGPRRSRGRDGVGTCSDGTYPNLPYRHCLHITKKEMTLLVISFFLYLSICKSLKIRNIKI